MLPFRTKLGLGVGVALVSFSLASATTFMSASAKWKSPETIEITPRMFTYRMAGDFHAAGRSVDATAVTIPRISSLHIMRRQVTAEEYGRCIAAGRCKKTSNEESRPNLPITNVSWFDATDYATWLSKETGHAWRLPTDEEWVFAAGSRFHDDALPTGATSDPSVRWLARYEKEVERQQSDKRLRPIGSFGANEYGLLDLSGNVWEWTNTCFIRQSLDVNGRFAGIAFSSCGVRVVEGEHRAYITDFIRDAGNGGCAAGKPPSNLGFRLVRDETAPSFILKIKRLLAGVSCQLGRSEICHAVGLSEF
ncbi:formylglycine-generating enzyme family protein [Methylocystis sp. WRRC1]|uniref:SUMF1/EgtB/PvdO family nonheme iron enzyme n=1 Tax=Methylocystis sp. WRRC1 TaxID=1732014 RepID=UPI001D15331F|nr:SUMF1/EgtB/PvdO family nonheme iron enzyme [Methylocystis sp. WRRC1]MCC3245004.1 formylglycine-generating enzyme family protein [Methylocystis sp. WRRC1]